MENAGKDEGKRKALIIAISDYVNFPENNQLPFCRNDGTLMSDVLGKCNFEIQESCKLIGKVDGSTLRKIINDFFLRNATATDTLLFYFSGHGYPDGYNTHFMVSSDMDLEAPNASGFSFSELSQIVEKSKAMRKITILDCCYSGAAEAKDTVDGVANSGQEIMEKVFDQAEGKIVLASSLAGQESFNLPDEDCSTFTYYLVQGLNGAEGAVDKFGYVTPDSLGHYVYAKVTSLPKIKQKPIIKAAFAGDLKLAEYPNLRYVNPSVFSPEDFQKLLEDAYKRGAQSAENATQEAKQKVIQKAALEAKKIRQEYTQKDLAENKIVSNGDFTLRKNIVNLSNDELTNIRKAYNTIISLDDNRGYNSIAGIHGIPGWYNWNHQRNMHNPKPANLFLPWHRAYLHTFEMTLKDILGTNSIGLSWWDWTSTQIIPQAFSIKTVNGNPNPLYQYHIKLTTPQQSIDQDTVRSPGDPSELPIPAQIDKLLTIPTFGEFSAQLENISDLIHQWVGGTMSLVSFSSYDPLFWAHHSMIDKIWWLWQQKNGIDNIPDKLLNLPLPPFELTVKDVLDIHNLVYDYPNTVVITH